MRTSTILYHVRRRQHTIILVLLLMTGMFFLFKAYGLQKPTKYIPSRFNFFFAEEPTPSVLETYQGISNFNDKKVEPFPEQHIEIPQFKDFSPSEKDVPMKTSWNALNDFQVGDIRMMSIPEDPNHLPIKEPFILTGQTSAFENFQIPPPLGFPNSYEMNNELATRRTTPMQPPKTAPKGGKETKIMTPALPVLIPNKTIEKIDVQLPQPPGSHVGSSTPMQPPKTPPKVGKETKITTPALPVLIPNKTIEKTDDQLPLLPGSRVGGPTPMQPPKTPPKDGKETKITSPALPVLIPNKTIAKIDDQLPQPPGSHVAGTEGVILNKSFKTSTPTSPTTTITTDRVQEQKKPFLIQKMYEGKNGTTSTETSTLGPVQVSRKASKLLFKNKKKSSQGESLDAQKFKSSGIIDRHNGTDPITDNEENKYAQLSAPTTNGNVESVEDPTVPVWETEKQMVESLDDVEIFEVNQVVKQNPRKTEFGVK